MSQTVQQAAEQAKGAGQKGTVMFVFISKCHDREIPDRAPNPASLFVPQLVGKRKLLQWCYSYLSFSLLKALDEVYKVAETGEKAVKNVANQAASWGKSFGQWR